MQNDSAVFKHDETKNVQNSTESTNQQPQVSTTHLQWDPENNMFIEPRDV